MKIITRCVISWETLEVLEEDSYEYAGPVAQCKSSGSAPQPTDPYTQAAAQYGLATGTANYNAALDRTNSSNPLGSNTWSVTGTDGSPSSSLPSNYSGYSLPSNLGGGLYGFGSGTSPLTGAGATGATAATNGGSGAPIYSQSTSLSPWANQMLESPIDTSGVPGMPGGPNVSQNDTATANAVYGQTMGYLAPQEAQQSEQTQAQLEAEGAMPGSAAYGYGEQQMNNQQTFENTQAANNAVTAGNQEESTLYGLGSEGLQNQLAVRSAPISEYEALQGNPSANVSAATPDISGAFNSAEQAALAGYNANVSSNNATTGAVGGLASAALMAALMSSSDRRLKEDIVKIGKLDSGLNVYRFRYIGDPKPHIGVMAQEAEITHPHAVVEIGGFKYVNYGELS